jgi:hypothetical protein
MKKRATRSLNTLNSHRHNLKTSIHDWPSDIAHKLGLEHGHVDGRYDPERGWQIVTLHQGRTLYLDCDENNAVIHIT